MKDELTHISRSGNVSMVSINTKNDTLREAWAENFVTMSSDTLNLIISGGHHKGDVFACARIAGIMAAKKTADLIPLCHTLSLDKVELTLTVDTENCGVRINSYCCLVGKTGVEMEALNAASVAGLIIYDMCKSVDRAMMIGPLKLLRKLGGRSGYYDSRL